ncbi:DNA polymerase delta, subunit 4-domain-containing protein [Lentinula raphanica]|nr:DNA polymerase delta, subunit 4-domain-containing protein [Lentinula raphanica]
MPVAKRSSSSYTKQTRLSFRSSKGSGSGALASKNDKPQNKKARQMKAEETEDISSSSESSPDEVEEIEDPDVGSRSHTPFLKRKRSAVDDKTDKKVKAQTEDWIDIDSVPINQRPELIVNDARWRKIAAKAREVNGNLQLVHAEKENKIHDILRVFDLSYEYGPCYGVSRLDRWERAHAMGLSPPVEIRDILLTRQGVEDPRYAHTVFYNQSERI